MDIEAQIARFGVAAVFLGTAIEGETAAITGGILAHRDLLAFWQTVAAAAAGAYFSDVLIFLSGRRFRDHRHIQRIRRNPQFGRAIAALDRWPTAFTLGFRFVPGMRTAGPLAISSSQQTLARYMLLTGLASVVWGVMAVTIGYYAGHAIENLFGEIKRVEHILLLPALGVLVIIYVALKHRRNAARKK